VGKWELADRKRVRLVGKIGETSFEGRKSSEGGFSLEIFFSRKRWRVLQRKKRGAGFLLQQWERNGKDLVAQGGGKKKGDKQVGK